MNYYTERDERLIQRVTNEPEVTLEEIALDEGISVGRLRQIMRENNVNRKRTRKKKTRYIDQDPVSPLHAQIGQDVSYYKNRHRLSSKEFSRMAKMTPQRLRAIELGVAGNLTVTEIVRLARACEVAVEYLITLRTTEAEKGAA